MQLLNVTLVLAAIGMMATSANAQQPGESLFDQAVHDYLLRHPEVLMEMTQKLQSMVGEAGFAQHSAELARDARDPVGGNPKGDITIVEFFDNQCPICKDFQPTLEQLVTSDKGIRVVYKEFPILGPASQAAAKVAIASMSQGKYEVFHAALMKDGTAENQLTEKHIYEIAESVGLDVAKLKEAVMKSSVQDALTRNTTLAEQLHINATPTLYVGNHLISGAPALAQLNQLVAQVRREAAAKTAAK